MSHAHTTQSPQNVSEAIERLDAWAETLTPEDFEATYDLVAIARAADAVEAAKAALEAAVANARTQDRSWNHIALSLGVSRQAARQRFGDAGLAERARRARAAGLRSDVAARAAEKRPDPRSVASSPQARPDNRAAVGSNELVEVDEFPEFEALMRPLLQFLADGDLKPSDEIREVLASRFSVTTAMRSVLLENGTPRWNNLVAWALHHLSRARLVDRPRKSRAAYRITQRGQDLLASGVAVDVRACMQYPEWHRSKRERRLAEQRRHQSSPA
jgi:Mrr N-terminal domain